MQAGCPTERAPSLRSYSPTGMTLVSGVQLLRSAFHSSEAGDRVLIQEKLTVTPLLHSSSVVRCGAASPIAKKPWRDDHLPLSTAPPPALLHQSLALLPTQPPPSSSGIKASSSAAGEEVEELVLMGDSLTSLQRSLLESQWVLSTAELELMGFETHGNFHLPASRFLKESLGAEVVSSGRPSARERRLQTRKVSDSVSPTLGMAVALLTTASSDGAVVQKPKRGRPRKQTLGMESVSGAVQPYPRHRTNGGLLKPEEEVHLSKKMKIGQNLVAARRKLAIQMGTEPTPEEWAESLNLTVHELSAKLNGAVKARDEMFAANLRLVYSVARKHAHFGLDLTDLIQGGSSGLLRGLEKFDYKRGFKLSTYVHWWIRQGVTRAIAEHSRLVRLPLHVHDRLLLIRKTRAMLLAAGASLSPESISESVNLSARHVANTLKVTKKIIYVDKPKRRNGFDEDAPLISYLADPIVENKPWATVDQMMLKEDIKDLLGSCLTPREQEIIRLHYGLERADGWSYSLENISHRMGLSRERVRQIEAIARRKLLVSSQNMVLEIPATC